MFMIRQKVVCVDASTELGNMPTHLTEGAVYTVASVITRFGREGITVCEIPEPPYSRPGWLARRFRPAVERKTDIAIFKKLLAPKRQRELAD